MSTVIEIIKKHLIDNGFDGLCNGRGCYCALSYLKPCDDEDISMCKPGYASKDNSGIFENAKAGVNQQ